MKIAIGSDHGGYPLNEKIIADVEEAGHTVVDFGTHDGTKPDDYPDYARFVRVTGTNLDRIERVRFDLKTGEVKRMTPQQAT